MKKIVHIVLILSFLNTSVPALNAIPLDDYPINTSQKSVQKAVPSIVPIILLGSLGTFCLLVCLAIQSYANDNTRVDSPGEKREAIGRLKALNKSASTEDEISDNIKLRQRHAKMIHTPFMIAFFTFYVLMIDKIEKRNKVKETLEQAKKNSKANNASPGTINY